jgi:hypothetical protein
MTALREIGTKTSRTGRCLWDSVDRGWRVEQALPTRVGPRARVPKKVARKVEGA